MATTKKNTPIKNIKKKSGVKRTATRKSSGVKAKAGTGYVLKKSTRSVKITPKHKEWYDHGPGQATIVDTRRHHKKPSWLKPWRWYKPLVNRKVTVTRTRKKTNDRMKEAMVKNRRTRARNELKSMRLMQVFGLPTNASREYKLILNSRSPYSARLNARA